MSEPSPSERLAVSVHTYGDAYTMTFRGPDGSILSTVGNTEGSSGSDIFYVWEGDCLDTNDEEKEPDCTFDQYPTAVAKGYEISVRKLLAEFDNVCD